MALLAHQLRTPLSTINALAQGLIRRADRLSTADVRAKAEKIWRASLRLDELVETIASRLALDVRRVTLTFDPDNPGDRERMARVYRHARVLVHEVRDGRVSMVADVPRRLVAQLGVEVNFS